MSPVVSADAFGALQVRVDKHQKDLYEGNGKPALTVRMALVESDVSEVKESLQFGRRLMITSTVSGLMACVGVLILIVLRLYR